MLKCDDGGIATPNELDEVMPPLKVTCTSVDCERNLHCFLKKRGMPLEALGGCRACGAKLVDWARVQRRDPSDADFTFQSLKHEMIRHHMWHVAIDQAALDLARKRGRAATMARVEGRLRASIGKASGAFDGRQTPMQGNVTYYAQHATATCCRKCLHYWHGIAANRSLSASELAYCVDLVTKYLDERLRDLPDWPQRRAALPAIEAPASRAT